MADVVVLGGGLSAAICAALLARRGVRGTLVDQGEAGDGPELSVPASGSAAMERVHAELGIEDGAGAPAGLQVIFADQRLDLTADRDATLADVVRVVGRAAAGGVGPLFARLDAGESAAGAFLAQVGTFPPEGFFARRTADKLARGKAGDRAGAGVLDGAPAPIAEVLVALLPFAGYTDPRGEVTTCRLARAAARWLRGGASEGLRKRFVARAEAGGFRVVPSAVEQVEVEAREVRIVLSDGARITAGALVDASTDLAGLSAVGARKRPKALSLTLQSAAHKGSLHALGLAVDAHVLPPGLGDRVLLLNGRRAPRAEAGAEDRPILMWRLASSPERARFVVLHPVSSARQHALGAGRIAEGVEERIERLIPFLSDGHPELVPLAQAPPGWPRLAPHPHFDPELDPIAGVGGIPTRTPWPHVFAAGPAVLPGLGVEGDYMSALAAANAAELRSKGRS